MAKPISKNDYKRFCLANGFFTGTREPIAFHKAFIKVFHECRGLVTKVQAARIKELAKSSEKDAKDYIETELVVGMEVAE